MAAASSPGGRCLPPPISQKARWLCPPADSSRITRRARNVFGGGGGAAAADEPAVSARAEGGPGGTPRATPQPAQHRFDELVRSKRAQLLELVADGGPGRVQSPTGTDGGWTYLTSAWVTGYGKEEKWVRIWKRDMEGPGEANAASKAVGVIKAPIRAVQAALLDSSFAKECSGGYTEGVEVVDTLGGDDAACVVHSTFGGVFPVSARDFVNCTHHEQLDGGRFLMINFSVDHLPGEAERFPASSGYVRGRIYLVGYVLSPERDVTGQRNWTLVQMISHVSPGGSIPTWFLNKSITVGPPAVFKGVEGVAKRLASS